MTPQSPSNSSPATETGDAQSFVRLVLASEGILVLGAVGLGWWSGTDWAPMLRVRAVDVGLGVLVGLGLVALHLGFLLPGGQRNPLYRMIYRPLRTTLEAPLRGARLVDVVALALTSGVAEEVFFRGWLQTEAGIVIASVVFGAAHVWERDAVPYGLYAVAMGAVLGGLFSYTEDRLWAPIVAHVVNNLVGLLALAYGWLPDPHS